jgi:hypothetical protein
MLACCGARSPGPGTTPRHTMPEQLQAHSTDVFQHELDVHGICRHPGSAFLPCLHQIRGAACHVVWFVGQEQRLAHVLLWCPCCHLHDGPGDSKLLNDAWRAKISKLFSARVWHYRATAAPAQHHQGGAFAPGCMVNQNAVGAKLLGAAPGSWSRRPGTGCPSPRS